MKKLLWAILFLSFSVLANDLDTKCPTFVYKSAPVATADQFICHTQYGIAYNYATKTAVYTTEYLDASHTGDAKRTNDFRPDPAIPTEHSATLKDYLNTSTECNGARCDRGHMTPDQDFSSSPVTTSESFFLSNMVPQNFQNNEIIWKYMETKIRKYVAAVGPVYVVTGPIYIKKPYATIGTGVAVPDRLFKAVIDAKTGKSIAFLMDNTNYPVSSLAGLVVPLQDVEKVTGIIFDKSLDKKTSASYQAWFSPLK